MFLVLGVNVILALGEYLGKALTRCGVDLSLGGILAQTQECRPVSVGHNLREGLLES